MKLKFTMNAVDKNDSNTKYVKGKTYDFEKTRAEEILKVKVDGKPVAEKVKAEAKKPAEKKAAEK